MTPGKPAPIFPNSQQVPAELCASKRWVGYRYKWNGHKFNKPPHSPVDGSAIGATEKYQEHFLSFEEALAGAIAHRLDGIGLVILAGDGVCGIDFDDAISDGVISPDVEAWLKWFPSYTELSPSGRGLHVICKGSLAEALTATPVTPGSATKVEMYSHSRFLTFTGRRHGDVMQIADCQVGIDKMLAHVAGVKKPSASGTEPSRPISRFTASRIHSDNLTALRNAQQGEGNQLLNSVSFFAGRAFASGVFEQTEAQLKTELLHIVTKEWKSPHSEQGARQTIESGWASGVEKPLVLRTRDTIVTNPGHVLEMTRHSEQVLFKDYALKYFERNSELVHTAYGRDLPAVKEYQRDADSVVIQEASHQTIIRDLDTKVTYVILSEGKDGVEETVCHVPKILPSHIHDRVHSEVRDVPFHTLDMVTASPVLLPSGKVAQDVFEEGVLFVPRKRAGFPAVPNHPTHHEAQAALNQFDDIFQSFPFVDPENPGLNWKRTASYASVLAGILSLVSRPYLNFGPVPLIGANAPTPRYGKSKVIGAMVAAALGHKPTMTHFVDEEEFGKHLLPLMRAGDRAILIDNVELTLKSAKLCILITECVLRDRILGESRDVVLKNGAVFFATGNNLTIGGDLATRALRIDLDAQVERPEARKFSFDPVERALKQHPQLVTAALTALRAYVLAGTPWGLERGAWGGFDRWDRLVSGCLNWLGYADPYHTRSRIISADPTGMANADILTEWFKQYSNRDVSLRQIREDEGEVYEALLQGNQWNGHHSQWLLRRLENKVIGGLRLVRLQGRSRFRVERMKDSQLGLDGFGLRD